MQQLTQQLKSGRLRVSEVPVPGVLEGHVLVRNHWSLISAGTESATVRTARKSLIGKAKERPQQVRQVLDALRTQGPVQTYRAVMKKLDSYSPLGYSSAGEVVDVGARVGGFAIGDKVACAGAGYANHAEVVSVPENLCVRLSDNADLKRAAYNTLGAIALQGLRQADLRLGESCAVIGLGLLGQLTCLMARAAGVRTYGVDIDPVVVGVACKHAADEAWTRDTPGIISHIESLTEGLGVDAVIITAASSSLDPINFAGEITRKRGRVVVVGAVPTGFDREPHYYRKELELRMSCSYGPGRYDLQYEEKGIDYPAAYVRWTEKRNMQAFQSLVQNAQIDLDYLTTHTFPFDDAPSAYELIMEGSEPFLGILLHYDADKPLRPTPIPVHSSARSGRVGIGFIGAGSYAQNHLLPNLPRDDTDVVLRGVMTSSGTTSKRVAERFGFDFCASRLQDVLGAEDINTVFVATRHDSHAHYVLEALSSGKHVFVEKPLCLREDELAEIEQRYVEVQGQQLLVGFNRRFSALTVPLKARLGGGPLSMIYRVNAGQIPSDSWIQDPDMGGGRILGEACHFIDLLMHVCGCPVVRVYASALRDPDSLNDTVCVNLEFENGSVGTLSYFANGSKSLPKEYLEVYQGGCTTVLNDFRELKSYGASKPRTRKLLVQDKGQRAMVDEFLRRIKEGGVPLIPPEEIFATMRCTFAVLESLRTRQPVSLNGLGGCHEC